MRLIYAEKWIMDGGHERCEKIVCTSLAEFAPFREAGYRSTLENDLAADKLIEASLPSCSRCGSPVLYWGDDVYACSNKQCLMSQIAASAEEWRRSAAN